MKILIVSQYFTPKNEIASIRITNFARGLARLGWEVDVLTVHANLANPLERRLDLGVDVSGEQGLSVITVPAPMAVVLTYAFRGALNRLREISREVRRGSAVTVGANGSGDMLPALSSARTSFQECVYAKLTSFVDGSYVRTFQSALNLQSEYDVCFVSFGPRYMIDVAYAMSRRFPEAKHVVDVRDPIVRPGHDLAMSALLKQQRSQTLAAAFADAFSLVSEELLAEGDRFGADTQVIPNGFSQEDVGCDSKSRPKSDSVLRLYYGGRLYRQQSLKALVELCGTLREQCVIEMHYAGPDSGEFVQAFMERGLTSVVTDHGRVSRSESLQLADWCDVAVVLSWNTSERGVMTGKVYELIAINVPILALVVGDHATSALAETFYGDYLRQVYSAEDSGANVVDMARWVMAVAEESVGLREIYDGPSRYSRFGYSSIVAELDVFLRGIVR